MFKMVQLKLQRLQLQVVVCCVTAYRWCSCATSNLTVLCFKEKHEQKVDILVRMCPDAFFIRWLQAFPVELLVQDCIEKNPRSKQHQNVHDFAPEHHLHVQIRCEHHQYA